MGVSIAALIALAPCIHAANFTLATQQASGADWNSTVWLPGSLGASTIIVADPVATFEMLPGSRLRSPNNATDATFPGPVLTLDGDSVLAATGSGATTSELRFKQGGGATGFGTNTFPKLVLNGGQLDLGNDGTVVINGEVNVAKNSSLINDGTNDRGYQINAKLTGSGNLSISLYAPTTPDAFRPTYTHSLNINGTNNPFSGQWNVLRGLLMATGNNSLGTNNITINSAAAFLSSYDINNPKGSLQVNGRMYLTQNDKFRSVTVGTTALAKGVHTFEELSANFPNNFPATWTDPINMPSDLDGNPLDFGRGSIEVLEDNTTPVAITGPLAATTSLQAGIPKTFTIVVTGPVTSTTWYSNNVVVATDAGLTYTTPPLAITANGAIYKVAVSNPVNTAESSTTLAISADPLNITSIGQEAIPESWETGSHWSDGNPASVSALANLLNTYEIVPLTRMRSPDNSPDSTFPGSVLKIDGDGVWNINLSSTIGELRFKQAGGVSGEGRVTFPKLVMNGGQTDVGNDGTVVIAGAVEIAKNSIFGVNNAGNRGYRIEAVLSGSGDIEFDGSTTPTFNASETHNLNIAGTNNPFSGKWNVVVGALLATGTNALGTNDITIGLNGAFQSTTDVNNPTGSLNLNGVMYLTANDTFRTVTVGGIPLAHGSYTWADLNAMFPQAFPEAWTPLIGAEDFSVPSGSITVKEDNSIPLVLTAGVNNARVLAGQTATFTVGVSGPYTNVLWYANDVLISGANGLTYTTAPVASGDNNTTYKVVVQNNVNSVQSSGVLTIGNPVVSQGFFKDEVWLGTGLVKDSLQDAGFLSGTAPNVTRFRTTVDGVTGQADNYIERLSGYFTPAVTGDYIFFLASDDDGALFLSTDANPDNKIQIAAESAYSNEHEWTTSAGASVLADKRSDSYNAANGGFLFNTTTTNQIRLTQGVRYYLEATHREGTGGDNVGVTFKLAGEADPASGGVSRLIGSLISVDTVDGSSLVLTNPVSVTVNVGTNATFTVGVNSSTTNLFYQWQRNEVNIPGATASSYTTGTLTAADDQARFRVIVGALGGPVQTSGTATLTVPTVTVSQPSLKNALAIGGSFTFAFESQLSLSYRVQYKDALSDSAWQTAETKIGTGTDIPVSYPITGTARFYQVVTP